MTAVQPGLSVRDSQILELLRNGAPVRRVVEIGRHRKAWTAVHVGMIVAFHLEDPPSPKPKPRAVRAVAECGTIAGHNKHRRHHEKVCDACARAKAEYQQAWAEKRRAEAGVVRILPPVWQPPTFTGRSTDVRLTPSQIDVLGPFCRGLSNPRIAAELELSEETVKTHVKAILAALGALDRAHAVAMVHSRQVRILGQGKRGAA